MRLFMIRKNNLTSILILFIVFFSVCLLFYHPLSFAIAFQTDWIFNKDKQSIFSSLSQNTEKIAYLTFDDGPTLRSTSRVLDVLQEEEVQASFFVIGKYVEKHPELVKRAYEEGHYIANHGYDHRDEKLYQSDESFIQEIKNTDAAIGNAIGISDYCSHVFRFPHGFQSSLYKAKKKRAVTLLSDMNYVYVDWNCLNHDSVKKYSASQLLSNLKSSSKHKGTLIILMHDTGDVSDTASVLKESIHYLKSQGYTFHNFYDFIPKNHS